MWVARFNDNAFQASTTGELMENILNFFCKEGGFLPPIKDLYFFDVNVDEIHATTKSLKNFEEFLEEKFTVKIDKLETNFFSQ